VRSISRENRKIKVKLTEAYWKIRHIFGDASRFFPVLRLLAIGPKVNDFQVPEKKRNDHLS